jgi:2,3-bisphosphoglycerate-independent phosphoglycerate mutase
MLNVDDQADRAATANQVPFHLVDEASLGIDLTRNGSLKDVAPTMLGMLGIEQPNAMTGLDLRTT